MKSNEESSSPQFSSFKSVTLSPMQVRRLCEHLELSAFHADKARRILISPDPVVLDPPPKRVFKTLEEAFEYLGQRLNES